MSPISRIRSWSTPKNIWSKGKNEYPRYTNIYHLYMDYIMVVHGQDGCNILGSPNCPFRVPFPFRVPTIPGVPQPGPTAEPRFHWNLYPTDPKTRAMIHQYMWPWCTSCPNGRRDLLPKTVKNGWEETLEIGVYIYMLTELVSYMYPIYVHHMYIFDVLSFPFGSRHRPYWDCEVRSKSERRVSCNAPIV